jgi:hypothetical protein
MIFRPDSRQSGQGPGMPIASLGQFAPQHLHKRLQQGQMAENPALGKRIVATIRSVLQRCAEVGERVGFPEKAESAAFGSGSLLTQMFGSNPMSLKPNKSSKQRRRKQCKAWPSDPHLAQMNRFIRHGRQCDRPPALPLYGGLLWLRTYWEAACLSTKADSEHRVRSRVLFAGW